MIPFTLVLVKTTNDSHVWICTTDMKIKLYTKLKYPFHREVGSPQKWGLKKTFPDTPRLFENTTKPTMPFLGSWFDSLVPFFSALLLLFFPLLKKLMKPLFPRCFFRVDHCHSWISLMASFKEVCRQISNLSVLALTKRCCTPPTAIMRVHAICVWL